MNYTTTQDKLMQLMAGMDIIDCHEHLPPEQERTGQQQDVFTLVSHYTRHDLFSAGMAEDQYQRLYDYDLPLEQRWAMFKPFWQAIRYGSYARAALLTAKMVYGFEDINDQTYQPLSEKIAAENTPGIYQRILCDRCRIRASMTQCGRTDVGKPLVPVMPGLKLTQLRTRQQLEELAGEIDQPTPTTLDDCLNLAGAYLDKWVAQGAIGIKFVSQYNLPADAKEAQEALNRLLAGRELTVDRQNFEVLENYLTHHVIDLAAERDLVIAVHAGIWGDFRNLDAKHMLTLAPAHPQARFDLYHLGMPAMRDTIVIGKNLPNVYLNLCWTHIISQAQACSGIDELLDQVPVNKVLAFGGDYRRPVEKVVGHLHMAREDFAQVFARRIDNGIMSFDEAEQILKLWFWDNPLRLYTRLSVS